VNSRFAVISMMMLSWGRPLPAQRVSIDAALHTSDRPYIQATGEATISAKPDQALIEIDVVSQGTTGAAAAALNARQTETVLAELRKVLSGSNQIKTANYSVRPNYQYPKPGATATISGYSSKNVVEVTLDDLALVGKVIDTAIQSGVDNIQKLEFRLKNSRLVRTQALREAAAEARANVGAIAAGLGLRVMPPPLPPPSQTAVTTSSDPVQTETASGLPKKPAGCGELESTRLRT
jgi:uncharacterized protein YggE